MNELDVVMLAVVAVSSLVGYFRGAVKEALGALGIIISAAVTYICFKQGGSLLSLSLTFILTNLAFSAVLWILRRFVWKSETGLSLPRRMGGVAVGFLKGIGCLLIMLVSLDLFGGIIKVTRPDINDYLETSLLYARYRGTDPAMPKASKEKPHPAALPKEMVREFSNINSVKAILEDKQLIEDLNQEDYVKVISNPKFRGLLNDPEFLKQVITLGLRQGRKGNAKTGALESHH